MEKKILEDTNHLIIALGETVVVSDEEPEPAERPSLIASGTDAVDEDNPLQRCKRPATHIMLNHMDSLHERKNGKRDIQETKKLRLVSAAEQVTSPITGLKSDVWTAIVPDGFSKYADRKLANFVLCNTCFHNEATKERCQINIGISKSTSNVKQHLLTYHKEHYEIYLQTKSRER